MTQVYLIQNQQQLYYAKDGTWLDYKNAKKLFYSEHKDIALNQLIEVNSKHIDLRLILTEAKLDNKTPQLNLPFTQTETTPTPDTEQDD